MVSRKSGVDEETQLGIDIAGAAGGECGQKHGFWHEFVCGERFLKAFGGGAHSREASCVGVGTNQVVICGGIGVTGEQVLVNQRGLPRAAPLLKTQAQPVTHDVVVVGHRGDSFESGPGLFAAIGEAKQQVLISG